MDKLKNWNENAYTIYKKAFFGKLPPDLVQLLITRNLRSIDRVFLTTTKDRRQDAIKQLNLAAAQIVAYIANNVGIDSAETLPLPLRNELEAQKLTKKILFGLLPDFAIWPARCPLPGNRSYDMYSNGPKPDARYVNNKDGTVTDLCTNLIWEQSTSTLDWKKAKSHCARLNKANFNDWRLPNSVELQTIVDYTKSKPAINSIAFPNTPHTREGFWSSSVVDPENPCEGVFFDNGVVSSGSIVTKCRARCVR